MHPEILRELGSQRDSEMRQWAQRDRLARQVRRAARARRGAKATLPAVPDFVDGSFLAERTAKREPGRARLDRRAA
jgi:hypothetical protein